MKSIILYFVVIVFGLQFIRIQAKYAQVASYAGSSFFQDWDFWHGPDPTHGFVDYVSEDEARKEGYISTDGNKPVYIGADHKNVASDAGRKSVRITTKKNFNHGLFIIDLTHMPTGCGNWPAWWTVGPNWPKSGEIDVIEGVNNGGIDQTTLHTGPGCEMSSEDKSKFTGKMVQPNCVSDDKNNQGCAILASGDGTYGQKFNEHQGGVFAMEWTNNYIQTFYFPRDKIPKDIGAPNPASWGKPYAYFQLGPKCSASHFANHQIVIDNTFCGDWAGAVFNSQCPGKGDCKSFVKNNPGQFADAYWIINYIKVFEDKSLNSNSTYSDSVDSE